MLNQANYNLTELLDWIENHHNAKEEYGVDAWDVFYPAESLDVIQSSVVLSRHRAFCWLEDGIFSVEIQEHVLPPETIKLYDGKSVFLFELNGFTKAEIDELDLHILFHKNKVKELEELKQNKKDGK